MTVAETLCLDEAQGLCQFIPFNQLQDVFLSLELHVYISKSIFTLQSKINILVAI